MTSSWDSSTSRMPGSVQPFLDMTHDALDAISVGITRRKVSWVLDADIHGFSMPSITNGW